jgi:hypothetical protein
MARQLVKIAPRSTVRSMNAVINEALSKVHPLMSASLMNAPLRSVPINDEPPIS